MQNFIVLGIIPGINYQTTFSFWLSIACALFGLINLPKFIAFGSRAKTYLAMRKIAHTIDHFDLITI